MIYQRFSPDASLAPFVECYWHLRRDRSEPAGVERILPDGCTELIFNVRTPFRVVAGEHERRTQPRAMLVGQISRCLLIEPTGAVDIIAVRFTPAGAAAFFPFSLREITDEHAPLAAVEEPWRGLEERLHERRTTAARLRLLEETLLTVRRTMRPGRAAHAVARLRTTDGRMRIRELADELNLSARQLERDFTREVGLTPKQFARIVRFQRVMRAFADGGNGWADVAADCGYTDQAHLVNEFRKLSGLAPRDYFRNETPMGAVFVGY